MGPEVGYYFPVDTAGEWDGFNDPGLEHFAGNPFLHLGKELAQNSLDAAEDLPVKLSFSLAHVPTRDIPGVEELRQTIDRCRQSAEKESEKSKAFFARAQALLREERMPVLLVSDYGTTGIRGPCENGHPYFSFMKSVGQSRKATSTGLGSYGIGKYAPYVASELRTLFVSTVWQSDSGLVRYVQGKSILMSHIDESGQTYRSVGYWGLKEGCLPISEPKFPVPTWLNRQQKGTTIAIVGFKPVAAWDVLLAASIAQSFFGAIRSGRLHVAVGEICLDDQVIGDFMARPDVSAVVEEHLKNPDDFREASHFLTALQDDGHTVVGETENLHLGNCEVRIRVAPGLPKRVAILRDGMFITSDLEKLKRFPDFKEFVAVVQCKTDRGNELLRKMEPPRHDDFEPERLQDAEEKRKAKLALRQLAKWVRDMLVRHARDPVSDETSLDELAVYFADEHDRADKPSSSTEIDPRAKYIVRAKPFRLRPKTTRVGDAAEDEIDDSNEHGEAGGVVDNGGGGRGNGLHQGGGTRGTSGGQALLELSDVRAVPLGPRRRHLFFTPNVTGAVALRLEISGADRNEPLRVVSSSRGRLERGAIEDLEVTANQRMDLEVELEEDFVGTVRLVGYAV